MQIFKVLFIAAGLSSCYMSPATSQSRFCADRESVIERLAEDYNESRMTIGIGGNNLVVEQFANKDSGTWTILVTRPDGTTCLIASGLNFELLEEDPAPSGEDL